jgi:hypothetical protein
MRRLLKEKRHDKGVECGDFFLKKRQQQLFHIMIVMATKLACNEASGKVE